MEMVLFDIVKSTLFVQVFIIVCKSLTGVTVPCAFYLLPNKEYLSYKYLFESIRNLGLSPPKIFYCDFEQSIIKAVNDVFPETTIVCCDAHFKRAIRRNIQAKHLQSSYNRSIGLQTLVRYLWGLSLVPVTDVIKVWEQFILPSLPEDAPAQWEVTEEHLENFLEYFEKTWIGGKDIRTNSRRNPRYRHELWNKYDAVINDNDTTTNASEGFNHVLQMSIPNHTNI